MVWDLAKLSGEETSYGGVMGECQAGRAPPLTPADFSAQLESKSFTFAQPHPSPPKPTQCLHHPPHPTLLTRPTQI